MDRELARGTPRLVRWIMWIYSGINIIILLYLFYNSLRTRQDIVSNTFGLPESLSLDNYAKLLFKDGYFRYLLNSVLILAGALLLSIALSTTVAYALGHYQFKFKKFFKTYYLVGLMFPSQLGIVPMFLLMKNLNLINTYASVILICGSAISMSVFLLTNFFAGLPRELSEAAALDGAGEFRTFIQIMLPLASPVVTSMSILTAVQIWNQFFIPLIFLQQDAKKTVPLMVLKYTNSLLTTIDSAFAASILSIVPILALFFIFSRRVLSGIADGGIKG